MIRAWLQARATGPFSGRRPCFTACSTQVSTASGRVARKMMPK
jgi:hypothetical protein